MKKNKPLLERIVKALDQAQDGDRLRALALTAYHEAGHAIAQTVLGDLGMSVFVTLHDDDRLIVGGNCYCRGMSGTKAEQLRAEMIVLAAGKAAMKRHAPTSDGGGSEDDKSIRRAAMELCGAIAGKRRINLEIRKARRRAEKLIEIYWPEIQATAKRLIENHLFLEAIQRRTVAEL